MAKHSVNRHILGREIGRIWKTKKREGRKNGALSTLPRNSANFSTDDGLRSLIIPRERMNGKREWKEKRTARKKNWKKKAVHALYTRYSGEENNGKARVFRPGEGRIAVAHKPEQSRVSAGLIYERRGTASENSNRNGGILYCNRSPAPGKD